MRRSSSWWAGWIGGAVIIAAAWVGGRAVWLAVHDPVDFDAHRREALEKLTGEQSRLQTSLAEVRRRGASLAAELTAQQDRARLADRGITALRADDRWWRTAWDKLFGAAEQVRSQEERLARLEAMKVGAAKRAAELRETITRTTWERDGLEIALARTDRELAGVERDRSKAAHYLALAWRSSRWYVAAALAAWICAPILWRRSRHIRWSGADAGNRH